MHHIVLAVIHFERNKKAPNSIRGFFAKHKKQKLNRDNNMNYDQIISKLLAFGLSPLPVAPFQSEPLGKKTKKPIFTGKNPSYISTGAIGAITINHADYQKRLPTEQELTTWFRDANTGIGSLGSDRYRWLDLDRKHFKEQGDCDLALLGIHCDAPTGWLERTQSGGYRLLVDCGESGADFTNFALSEGGDHVGELLGSGRFAVMAPTIGANGIYENLNYGDAFAFDELNIFPATIKKAIAIAPTIPTILLENSQEIFRAIQDNSGNSQEIFRQFSAIPLEIVISKAHRDSLRGVYEGSRDNEGAALIRDLIGAYTWLLSSDYTVDGDPYALLKAYCSRCLPPLDDGDCERIYKSGLKDNPTPCLSEDKLQNCVDAYLRSKAIAKVDEPATTPKKYRVEFIHLCSNRVQRILMGESERVTIAIVNEAYQELRAWELALNSFPDTTATTPIKKIIEAICDENDLEIESVNFKAKPKSLPNKTLINETVRTWRYKFLEGDAEFEKAQFFALKGRVQRLLNTNLKFNTQMDNWFEYVDGVFVLREKDRIHGTVRHHLKLLQVKDWKLKAGQIKEATVKEYLENMKGNSIVEKFDDPKKTLGLINLKDGTYDRINKLLLDHQQEHGFTVQLPYKWSDAITSSASPIVQWLWDSLDGKIDQVFFALCYLNAIVTRRSDIQVLLQIIGKAGAGKSTFTRLAEALVGSANVQSTELKMLEEDKFELSNFIGRPLILINEIDTNYKGSGAILKGLTGGDRMVNRIKHKQSRGNSDFTYYGKIIITANEEFKPSRVFDDWDRRNRVLKFQKTVAKSKVRNLIENCEDGSIAGEFAPHLPAFLQLILSIDDTLVKNVLIEPEVYAPSMNEIRNESILRESSIAQWLEECVIFNPEAKTYIGIAKKTTITVTENGVSKSQTIFENADTKFHANYAQWCTDRGMAYTGFQRFSPDLLRIVNGIMKIDYVKKLNHDKIGTAIQGVELRTRYHDDIPTPIRGICTTNENDQTLANANLDVNRDKTLIYKLFLQDFIQELSDIPVEDTTNNSINFIDNDLHICTTNGSSLLTINNGVESINVAVEDNLRPVTVDDLGSANPAMIINIVDNTSGVLISLGRDGVKYGDYLAKPQNVRVKCE